LRFYTLSALWRVDTPRRFQPFLRFYPSDLAEALQGDVNVSTLLEILPWTSRCRLSPWMKYVFQPFLRFYGATVKWRCYAVKDTVSTLLEILHASRKGGAGCRPFKHVSTLLEILPVELGVEVVAHAEKLGFNPS